METAPAISAHRLTKRYGRTEALSDISFTVEAGEVVGFLGPNGAGKTTTLRILCGLTPATSGVARIDGLAVTTATAAIKRRIGYMPENNPLPEDLRVEEYLRLRARLKGIRGTAVGTRVGEVLEWCDLRRTAARKLIANLSKGYRQRVGIADSILARPSVAILDEPTIGLDPHQVIIIRRLLRELRGHTTVILSSHILAEVERSCDRVIILNHGRIVANGPPASLRQEFTSGPAWKVMVAGDAAAAQAALQRSWPEARVETVGSEPPHELAELRLSLPASHLNRDPDLSSLPATESVRWVGFYPREPTLEEVFLAATRRSWESRRGLGANPPETAKGSLEEEEPAREN